MTLRQFIDLIERKLAEHGIGKVIPDEDRINEAYRLFVRNDRIKQTVDAAIEAMEDVAIDGNGRFAQARKPRRQPPSTTFRET